MATNNINKSHLQRIHGVVRNTMIKYPKELIVHVLRDFFSQDDGYYHYDKDEFGFPNVVEQKDLPYNAGISTNDHSTTRLSIEEAYKFAPMMLPNIIVKFNSTKESMISFNKEVGTIHYERVLYNNPVTNKDVVVHIPKHFITAGAWEGTMSVEINARNANERDELTELVAMALASIYFEQLIEAGLIIKPLSVSGPSEKPDRTDNIYKQTISFEYRGEWERNIPIYSLIERIMVTIDFGNLDKSPPTLATDLQVKTEIVLSDMILDGDPMFSGSI